MWPLFVEFSSYEIPTLKTGYPFRCNFREMVGVIMLAYTYVIHALLCSIFRQVVLNLWAGLIPTILLCYLRLYRSFQGVLYVGNRAAEMREWRWVTNKKNGKRKKKWSLEMRSNGG